MFISFSTVMIRYHSHDSNMLIRSLIIPPRELLNVGVGSVSETTLILEYPVLKDSFSSLVMPRHILTYSGPILSAAFRICLGVVRYTILQGETSEPLAGSLRQDEKLDDVQKVLLRDEGGKNRRGPRFHQYGF